MASSNRPKVEFTPASINKVLELPPYQPDSQIHSAIGLLTGTGEGYIDPKSVSIIPIDLSGHNSVLIRFKKPVMPYVPKAKGLDNHELRIQRLADTDPRTEELDRASRDGYDTGHDALLASMNNVRQSYFSTNDVLPSPQLIRVQAQNGDMVEIPLYVPIIFFGPTGKKSVAIVTRFPREYIAVETSKSLDKPVGVLPVGKNIIVRPPVALTPKQTFEWAIPREETPIDDKGSAIPIPTIPVDGTSGVVQIDFNKIEADRAASTPLETIIAGIDRVWNLEETKKLLRVLDDPQAIHNQKTSALAKWELESKLSQQKADSPVVLFNEIATYIVRMQKSLDDKVKSNDGWLTWRTGPGIQFLTEAWRVDIDGILKWVKFYEESYKKGQDSSGKLITTDERRHAYIKYAGLKHLLNSDWATYKKWKN